MYAARIGGAAVFFFLGGGAGGKKERWWLNLTIGITFNSLIRINVHRWWAALARKNITFLNLIFVTVLM